MARYLKKNKNEIGLSPQELVFRGNQKIDQMIMTMIDFAADTVEEKSIESVAEVLPYQKKDSVTWLNIDGLHDIENLNSMGRELQLDDLILADVLDTNSRPKLHEYANWVFLSLKMLQHNSETNEISVENFSLIFNDRIVITFQEKKGDVFEPVRERIRNQKRKLRTSGTDYLVYALLDVVIDSYLYILGLLGEKIESFDEFILDDDPKINIIDEINHYKQELNFIRKNILPAKEMLLSLSKLESDFIHEKNDIHFKELNNNISQASDTSDSYREILSDQLTIYHTIISSKLNDIMKFLTIFSVIFIPLTFIAGIYGTNFEFLPELHFKYGYFIMLGTMLLITVGMLYYFRRKKWL